MTQPLLYDKDIREPLFDFLEEKYGKSRILEEKQIGKVRSDIVMVTPQLLYGIEIKSDADTYARLDQQVKYYNWYYDRNIIVVGGRHASHVGEHVSKWWGIVVVEPKANGEPDFYMLREAAENPRVKMKRKITILWRPELNRLLEKNHLPKYRERSKKFVQEKLLEKVPVEDLWPQVYEELFERDYTAMLSEIEKYRKEEKQKRRKRKSKAGLAARS